MSKRKLTPDEWSTVRQRWEGDPQGGFDWLAAEVRGWLGVDITRQAVGDMARRKGWKKGGEPSGPLPLSQLAQDDRHLAQDPQAAKRRSANAVAKVQAEPVDLLPGQKPLGYAGTGRPSLYRPEYDQMIVDYFDKEPCETVEVPQGNGLVKLQRIATDPPMLVGFAKTIGVSVDTLTRWTKETGPDGALRYPGFAEAYAHARELQASLLARGAVLGLYDGRFMGLLMKNVHAWQDHVAKEVAAAPVSAEELDRLYGARMRAAHEKRAAVLAERAHLWADDA